MHKSWVSHCVVSYHKYNGEVYYLQFYYCDSVKQKTKIVHLKLWYRRCVYFQNCMYHKHIHNCLFVQEFLLDSLSLLCCCCFYLWFLSSSSSTYAGKSVKHVLSQCLKLIYWDSWYSYSFVLKDKTAWTQFKTIRAYVHIILHAISMRGIDNRQSMLTIRK